MITETDGGAARLDAAGWMRKLTPYRQARTGRAIVELLVTAVPFGLAWAAMAVALHFNQWWLYALLILPAAGLLVRLFMIQHDCGHGSFFRQDPVNDWTGRVLGVLTLTAYDHWRRSHAMHHASSGNLDRRGVGDVDTLTVAEYLALPGWRRFGYRLYRHPAVMFGLGPAYTFVFHNRLPIGLMRKGWIPWVSTMVTNAAIAALVVGLMWAIGVVPFLLVHLPVVLIAAAIGVWLFYIQHQFEETHWADKADWNLHEAALHGSSHYDLPKVLAWFTANIGIHHVHHLASRIPYYRLPEVLRDFPEFRDVGRITLWQSFSCVPLVLWDEAGKRLVSFREIRTRARAAG